MKIFPTRQLQTCTGMKLLQVQRVHWPTWGICISFSVVLVGRVGRLDGPCVILDAFFFSRLETIWLGCRGWVRDGSSELHQGFLTTLKPCLAGRTTDDHFPWDMPESLPVLSVLAIATGLGGILLYVLSWLTRLLQGWLWVVVVAHKNPWAAGPGRTVGRLLASWESWCRLDSRARLQLLTNNPHPDSMNLQNRTLLSSTQYFFLCVTEVAGGNRSQHV